jgi:hypothetical protein
MTDRRRRHLTYDKTSAVAQRNVICNMISTRLAKKEPSDTTVQTRACIQLTTCSAFFKHGRQTEMFHVSVCFYISDDADDSDGDMATVMEPGCRGDDCCYLDNVGIPRGAHLVERSTTRTKTAGQAGSVSTGLGRPGGAGQPEATWPKRRIT